MLTKAGLLSLLDRIKEAIERDSAFGLVRYEMLNDEYIVHAQIRGFDKDHLDKEARIAAV